MSLSTSFTRRLDVEHPIASAPMAMAAGGTLAAAVSRAGGLGLIGGGYGDRDWLTRAFDDAAGARVGCGFITWSLAHQPDLLDLALDRSPVAIMLSFGDPAPFASQVRDAGVPLICQVNKLDHARRALDVGADVLVAQGAEAGGHGRTDGQSTLTFVPAVVDLVADGARDVPVLAAGGVADGRGLTATLALGAAGVLVGSRFWASREAVVSPHAQDRALRATGDETIRTAVYDIVRGHAWPSEYTIRVLRNRFADRWHGREDQLVEELTAVAAEFRAAVENEDYDVANATVGQAVGLIHEIPSTEDIVRQLVHDASQVLRGLQ